MGIEQTLVKLALAGALAMSVSACGSEDAADYSNVKLKINEVQSQNAETYPDVSDGSYPDWLELYNAGDAAVNLKGFLLGDAKNEHMLPADAGEIAAKGYLVLFADKNEELGPLHLPFKFSGSSDIAVIADPNGKQLDSVDIPPMTNDQGDLVYARFPDGTGDFVVCPAGPADTEGGATPGKSNGASCEATTAAKGTAAD